MMWDTGARRTVYLYYKDSPAHWIGFAETYYFMLKNIEERLWVPMRSYSAFAVYLARTESPFYAFVDDDS